LHFDAAHILLFLFDGNGQTKHYIFTRTRFSFITTLILVTILDVLNTKYVDLIEYIVYDIYNVYDCELLYIRMEFVIKWKVCACVKKMH
jgi:hypothetical protein